MRYHDIFIDFDDTLYDTYGNAVIALRELFALMELDRYFPEPDVFYDAYWRANIDLWKLYARGEITRDYLIIERFRRPLSLGRGVEPTAEYCMRVSDLFLDLCADKPGLVVGARELVDYLRARGYRLHLCSNGFHEVQYRKLHACGLEGCFDNVVLSEDAGYNKPDPRFFDYAISLAGATRDATLMIGDNLDTDILGAQRAGIDAAYYNRFPGTPVPDGVTCVVESLLELKDIL